MTKPESNDHDADMSAETDHRSGGFDPTQTKHPAGEKQAAQNAAEESPS